MGPTADVRICLELVQRCREITRRANELHREIAALVQAHAPGLTALPGCASLTAAKIVAETAQVGRFPSEGHFARYAGAAPVPASSGATQRQRLNRRGNRQLNAAQMKSEEIANPSPVSSVRSAPSLRTHSWSARPSSIPIATGNSSRERPSARATTVPVAKSRCLTSRTRLIVTYEVHVPCLGGQDFVADSSPLFVPSDPPVGEEKTRQSPV